MRRLVRLDVPLMIAVSVLVWLLSLDGELGRGDGALLFVGIVAYTAWAILSSRSESRQVQREYAQAFEPRDRSATSIAFDLGRVALGVALLVLGSTWLVRSATELAEALGVSDLVIGLTLVAVGTSLPELTTSLVASIRGERDIAVGNVVGSNIFNILSVLGLTALVAPHGVAVASSALRVDLPVMIAVALACLPIFFTGRLIARWEGLLFVGTYAVYVLYLYLEVTQGRVLGPFELAMLGFVLPIVALTLGYLGVRAIRQSPASR